MITWPDMDDDVWRREDAAPATGASGAPGTGLDGRWSSNNFPAGATIHITGGHCTVDQPFTADGNGGCTVSMDGEEVQGQVSEDGLSIAWRDMDSGMWRRRGYELLGAWQHNDGEYTIEQRGDWRAIGRALHFEDGGRQGGPFQAVSEGDDEWLVTALRAEDGSDAGSVRSRYCGIGGDARFCFRPAAAAPDAPWGEEVVAHSVDDLPDSAAGDAPEPAGAEAGEAIFSVMALVDEGLPFEFVWPGVRESVQQALGSVLEQWPDAGWRSFADLEATLERSLAAEGANGAGAVARGLRRPAAEAVAAGLSSAIRCEVREDRPGAGLAAEVRREHEARRAAPPSAVPAGLQAALAGARGREELLEALLRGGEGPGFAALQQLLSGGPGRGLAGLVGLAGLRLGRVGPQHVLGVERARLLRSALGPVLGALARSLRPGAVAVKYQGEQAVDGEGGGGVTRAFLTHAGERLRDTRLGLLLPAHGGQHQLSPSPGFLASPTPEGGEVLRQPDRWSRFLGRLLGMAVVHECPLGFCLVPSLCKQLLGEQPGFEDLQHLPGVRAWHSSLRRLLVNRDGSAERLGMSEDPTVEALADADVDKALAGLLPEATSRAQLAFEAVSVAAAEWSPKTWNEALELTTSLTASARSAEQQQRTRETLIGLLRAGAPPPADAAEARRRIRHLAAVKSTIADAGSEIAAAVKYQELAAAVVPKEGEDLSCSESNRESEESQCAAVAPSDWHYERASQKGVYTLRVVPGDGACRFTELNQYGLVEGELKRTTAEGEARIFEGELWSWGEAAREPRGSLQIRFDATTGCCVSSFRPRASPKCPGPCGRPMRWMDFRGGGYARGWNCNNFQRCGANRANTGPERWCCASCSADFCQECGKVEDQPFSEDVFATKFERPAAPDLARERSRVDLGAEGGEELNRGNLLTFAEALAKKVLVENLQPHLGHIIEEFRRVVPEEARTKLTWQKLQDAVSGRRLDVIDWVKEWQAQTSYHLCTADDLQVQLWWAFAASLPAERLKPLFSWCTGFAAIPATPWRFRIWSTDDPTRHPQVNTCMTDDPSGRNQGVKMPVLYLPPYSDMETLAHKFEWAVAGASSLDLQ